jgi:hypothetical protein
MSLEVTEMKKWIGLLCAGIAVLGIAGGVMGSGYILNPRVQQEGESAEQFEAMIARDKKTGWASVGAGIAVSASSVPLFFVLARLLGELAFIRKSLGPNDFKRRFGWR